MVLVYNILVGIAVLIAIAFSLLVLITGKGDAMSGGGSVRTTFKGKASFDDIMSKWTLYIGASFMALILIINVVAKRLETPLIERSADVTNTAPSLPASTPATTPSANVPSANVPSANLPSGNVPAPTAPIGNAPSNGPLDSAPATVPSTTLPNEPTIVPTVPGTSTPGTTAPGTTAGGATNAAPPVGNR